MPSSLRPLEIATPVKKSHDGFMWVGKNEYRLGRKETSYCIVIFTNPKKRVSTGFPTNVRAVLWSGNFLRELRQVPAGLPANQVEALTFSVDKNKWSKRKRNLLLHKLRAHWYQHWKEMTHAWLELFVDDHCYLRLKIIYSATERRKQVPSV